MEASPMLDDNHSSNKQPDTSGGELVSPAQLQPELQQPSSSSPPPPPPLPHPQQSQSTPVTTEDTPLVEPTMTISKGNDLSSSEISIQEQNHLSETNHRESNIKLKRCKHGRIIIKDLSRKKLAQQSDIEANNICVSKEESNNNNNNNNNNHIATANDTQATIANNNNDDPSQSNHHEKDNHLISTRIPRNNLHEPSKTELSRVKNLSLPRTPPLVSAEKSPSSRDLKEKTTSKDGPSNKEYEATKSDSWSASSSGSSLSPLPSSKKRSRTPSRQSRKSRSPSTKERSSSRSRRRTSSRRRDSPSPRSRPRSPASSRKTSRRSSGRRRTPDRHRYSDNHRYRRRSSWSRSPSRRQPRSRSSSPQDRDRSYRRNRRDDSASPNRDKSRYDRSSHKIGYDKKSDTLDKQPRDRSPKGRDGSHRDSVESKATESHRTSQNTTNHQSHIPEARSSNSSRLPTQIQAPSKKSPRSAPPESKSMNVPAARSPQTNSRNDDSASSDIYDPEGPIIPISPGDSPPISPIDDAAFSKGGPEHSNNIEKNGEDDVPSSAVQLNQQEKYLQKLNRQERVVEEVKIALKPFYQNRTIGKEQYKEVLRKAVPKICHSKNGEINPIKIRSLVDAYVRKMR